MCSPKYVPGHELVLKYIKIEDKNDACGIHIKKRSSKPYFGKELLLAAPIGIAYLVNINTLPAIKKQRPIFFFFGN